MRGFHSAGFDILACVESDPHCCNALRRNSSHWQTGTEIMETDIRTADPSSLREKLAVPTGGMDLLFGGSPCQSFSQIGKKTALQDERGLLIFQFTRFAAAFQPRTILIEQVKVC